jgi:hypothetical protein
LDGRPSLTHGDVTSVYKVLVAKLSPSATPLRWMDNTETDVCEKCCGFADWSQLPQDEV